MNNKSKTTITKVAKKLLANRSLVQVSKKQASQPEVDNEGRKPANVFKFYSDDNRSSFCDKYKPLKGDDYNRFISSRAAKREPALTRLITSLSYKVGKQMVSLAEGMPNEEVFPFQELQLTMKSGQLLKMTGQELATALQYVPSRGLPALISSLREFTEVLHRPPALDRDVIVCNGAQHAIYQCCELFVEPRDPVLLSEFAYTGFHAALKPYDPEILAIPEDEDGIIPEALEAMLATRLAQGKKMPRILYTIPTGNNPTGAVLPGERRRQVYELACRYDLLILEDDPYMFLNYNETPVPSFLSMDSCGRVVRMDSFSKVVSAGLRAGWVTAPTPLVDRLELHAQAELLHSSSLSQAILTHILLDRKALSTHLCAAREFYRRRRDALHDALCAERLGELARWGKPSAGLFLWLNVHGVDDVYNMVFDTALQRGLMLVPGQGFQYDASAPSRHLRLTFSKVPLEKMRDAARLLADIIRNEQAATREKRLKSFATRS